MAGGDEVGEVADVVDVVLCGGGSALCGGFGEGGADGGEGGGGVGRGVLQKAIGLAKLFDLRWGEAAALEADFVETVGVVVALDRGQRVRQDVLGDGRASADVGVLADAAELVHGTERADDCVVLDDDVAGERGSVGEDASVADGGVVADVDVGHDEAAGADAGDASAGGCSARDGDVFADGVQVTDLTACRLACVLQILGRDAEAGEGEDAISGAQREVAVQDDVRDEFAVLAEDDVGADGAIRADAAGCWDLRAGSDDGGRVNSGRAHSAGTPAAGSAAGGFFMVRLVRAHMMVASQATLPSTVATPRSLTALVRQLRTVTSMRS